ANAPGTSPAGSAGSPTWRSRDAAVELAEVGDHLARSPLARLDRTVEVALEVDRGVLAAEVRVALLPALDPREARVLTDLPVGVLPPRPGVRGPEVDRRPPVPLRGHSRQHGLDLREELLRPLRRCAGGEAPHHRPA